MKKSKKEQRAEERAKRTLEAKERRFWEGKTNTSDKRNPSNIFNNTVKVAAPEAKSGQSDLTSRQSVPYDPTTCGLNGKRKKFVQKVVHWPK